MCQKIESGTDRKTLTKYEDFDPLKDSPLNEKGHNRTYERQRRPALGQIHVEAF